MKQTEFAKYLTYFMTKYLITERGCSNNTITAYRDAISLLLVFMNKIYNLKADNIDFTDITQQRIISFLEWLEVERKCGTSTRNARLAALHAFFRFLMYKSPD